MSQGMASSVDWDAREQEPDATAYQVDSVSASGQMDSRHQTSNPCLWADRLPRGARDMDG
jgi:hypothetical protein